MAEEEVDAIKAIFSLPGEVRVEASNTSNSKQCTVVVKPYENVLEIFPNCTLTVVVNIPDDYPSLPPTFSVFSDDLPRQDLSKLRSKATQYLEDTDGAIPGILPLLMSLQDEFSMLMSERLGFGAVNRLSSPHHSPRGRANSRGLNPREFSNSPWVMLILIDHMRAKTKYIKTLTNWSTELGVTGRLVFRGKLILNILEGDRQQLKEYLIRQKTVSVDVDSRGQKCKERMLNVLCEEELCVQTSKFTDFKVIECSDNPELEEVFHDAQLDEIYRTYVQPLCDR